MRNLLLTTTILALAACAPEPTGTAARDAGRLDTTRDTGSADSHADDARLRIRAPQTSATPGM